MNRALTILLLAGCAAPSEAPGPSPSRVVESTAEAVLSMPGDVFVVRP